MSTQITAVAPETEIRDLLNKWHKAVVSWDIDKIMSLYTQDVLSFDAIGQLQFKGVEAYRKHWEACAAMCPGPMVFEMHNLGVTASDDLAFCHYLSRCGGTDEKGEIKASWMRVTVCCRNFDGQWLIAHEHFSAPFDPQTGNALLDIQP